MGAKQMAQRMRSVLQIVVETNQNDRILRMEPVRDLNAARLIPDYLRVRESFAGH
jgi:hypothetical protein